MIAENHDLSGSQVSPGQCLCNHKGSGRMDTRGHLLLMETTYFASQLNSTFLLLIHFCSFLININFLAFFLNVQVIWGSSQGTNGYDAGLLTLSC